MSADSLGTRSKLTLNVVASEPREQQIEDDQIRRGALHTPECIDTIFNGNNPMAGDGQGVAVHLAKRFVVFNYEHSKETDDFARSLRPRVL